MPILNTGLPIDPVLPEIVHSLENAKSLVLTAEPGAGKSTVVPPAILDADFMQGRKIIMLEPRRLAARAAASRIASLLGEPVGKTAGYRTALENKCGPDTRILVVTEAILTRMIQHDPELAGIGTVIFDEFHERSIHADLALALTLDVRSAFREDLRIVLMSATFDAESAASFLGTDCKLISAPGRCYPVNVIYSAEHAASGLDVRTGLAVLNALRAFSGDILVFLPGEFEIRKTHAFLSSRMNEFPVHAEIFPLYGTLPAEVQDKALTSHDPSERRVILATPIAETSITIPGVRVVVDSGFVRVPKFSPASGMDKLETVRISRASAEQRRGRAGRVAEGTCIRLWSVAEENAFPSVREPEILVSDLTPMALELAQWGITPDSVNSLRWLDLPPAVPLQCAYSLLRQLNAVHTDNSITEHGSKLLEMGLHPRIAHAVLKFPGDTAISAASLMGEKDILHSPVSADLHDRLKALNGGMAADPAVLERVRKQKQRLADRLRSAGGGKRQKSVPADLEAALVTASAFPDRIGRWKVPHSGEYVLANGMIVKLKKQDPLADSEYIAVADAGGAGSVPTVFLAVSFSAELIESFFPELPENRKEVVWDPEKKAVLTKDVRAVGSLVLSRRLSAEKADDETLLNAFLDGIRKTGFHVLGLSKSEDSFRQRVTFLHRHGCEEYPDLSDDALMDSLEQWLGPFVSGLSKIDELKKISIRSALETFVTPAAVLALNKLAPEKMEVPSGSMIRIDYSDPNQPCLPVRLQEIFGMKTTPRLAGGKVPLLMDILSPAMRTVQKTSDLESFWHESYFLVRKDMRGRYPKHDWPEDPTQALPHRGVRKRIS